MPETPPIPVGIRTSVDVGGRRLNLWQTGTHGPAVLLVHGLPTNHLLWHDVVPQLEAEARVLAVDLLGFGWSDAPRGWRVDVAAQAGYLLTLLDALRVDRAVVVGHDIGSGVAQVLAMAAPDRVAGLGILNGIAFDNWPVPPVRAARLARAVLARTPPAVLAAAVDRGIRMLFTEPHVAGRFTPWLASPWRTPDGPARLAAHLRAVHPEYTETVAPFLPRLTMPAEILWGQRDTQLRPRDGERLAGALPAARLTRVPAGHFSPAEAPDAIIAGVRRLLSRLPSGSMTGSAATDT